jgi:coenzyme F420-0:L-glutamate ligase/coenzyme F420-1:gamma-L-glutamate ligase
VSDVTVAAHGLSIEEEVGEGDSISDLILEASSKRGPSLEDGDIIVVASKIVSKAEGRVVRAQDVQVSKRADSIAGKNGFDPVQVELALREAVDIIRSERVLITETHSGLVCNFSGVDRSNTPDGTYVLLPRDPDGSAERLRTNLESRTGLTLAVIMSDTQGRPWRKGSINIAIGCSGISPFKHNKGKADLYGRRLKRSTVCQVDEVCALAENLMGQAAERVPFVIVRGYQIDDRSGRCSEINRTRDEDLVR